MGDFGLGVVHMHVYKNNARFFYTLAGQVYMHTDTLSELTDILFPQDILMHRDYTVHSVECASCNGGLVRIKFTMNGRLVDFHWNWRKVTVREEKLAMLELENAALRDEIAELKKGVKRPADSLESGKHKNSK